MTTFRVPETEKLAINGEPSDDNTLYQVLIVEVDDRYTQGIKTTLWTLPHCDLPLEMQAELPSNGVSLKPDFLPVRDREFCPQLSQKTLENNLAKNISARNLLAYRKMSQLVASSWLAKPGEMDKNLLVRKLIMSGGMAPDSYINKIPVALFAGELLDEKIINANNFIPLSMLANTTAQARETNGHAPTSSATVQDCRSSIILPDSINWQYIRLSLLCAGQVYWKTGPSKYSQLWEPIFSTYEICVTFAFTMVSWSEYVAEFAELVQPGYNQKPPYYKVTFPYPPKPSEDVLSEEDLSKWANAPESGGQLPFYPRKENGKYLSDLVTNILPPYPYIPSTSTG